MSRYVKRKSQVGSETATAHVCMIAALHKATVNLLALRILYLLDGEDLIRPRYLLRDSLSVAHCTILGLHFVSVITLPFKVYR